jgi:hypothetical protein
MTASVSPSGWPGLEFRARRSPIVRASELKDDSLRQFVLVVAVLVLVVKVGSAVATGGVGGVLAYLVFPVVLLLAAAAVMSRMRLRVAADVIERHGGVRTKRVARGDVVAVYRVPVVSFGMQQGDYHLLIDHQGRCAMRMIGRLWEDADLERAWQQFNIPVYPAARSVSLLEMEEGVPGSTYLWERRPLIFGAVTATAIVAVGVIAAIAVVLLSGNA